MITGGKKGPRILVGGGAFVPPFRKATVFDLGMITVTSSDDETQSKSMVPVIVEWTAQLRADTSLDDTGQLNESIRNAILGFTNYKPEEISKALQQTLEGEVRAVVATLTPQALVQGKAELATEVNTGVAPNMKQLGYLLVSLNIGKISDNSDYFKNLAAEDREAARRQAANLTAEADQAIAVRSAEADQASKAAEQQRDLALAEQQRDLSLRRAAIKAETSVADADAEIAGQLQLELRNQDLATRQGQVEVIREQQNQTAAAARREVKVTEAETAKQTQVIEAEAAAQQSVVEAGAAADVAKKNAEGVAQSRVITAQGEADAISKTAEAESNRIRQTGLAQAEIARAQGEAEAAAILARGTSEAEAQRLMADALAANEGANLHVTLAEIESKTRITIATQTATVMAEVGKNAKFVDLGGGTNTGDNLFSKVLGDFPALLGKLDVQSDALNGASFGGALGAALAAIRNGEPVVPGSTSVEQPPAPASDASQASEEPTPAPVDDRPSTAESVKAPAPIVEPTPVSKPATITSPVIGQTLDDETLAAIVARAQAEGVSITELAESYGIPAATVEAVLSEKYTPGELLEKGIKLGKERSARKKS
ncbi:MAG: hypothetical protein JWO99_344 [Candidatus Saccharibacteria bacterium]|nr:hypothetical protein [Candidatus Saccharibacteria bacterium]